jgi:hypothetical protein
MSDGRATSNRVRRLRDWHRHCMDTYSSDTPPIWPIIWPIPDNAGNLRLIFEALLLVFVFLVYVTGPIILIGWLVTR